MAIALLSFVILALTTCEVCTSESATIECGTIGNIRELVTKRISRGEETIRGEWPFLAALFLVNEHENEFFCGGSLISSKHVLTAAHCIQDKGRVEKLLPGNVSVVLGAYNLTSKTEIGVQQRDVQEIFVHPEWNVYSDKYDADLAILLLKEFVSFSNYIRPVCMPTNDTVIEGVQGSVVGWGRTVNGTKPNKEFIKRVSITALNSVYCLTEYPEIVGISSMRTFCGQGKDGNANRGDSGGGLYVANKEHVYVQRGIVSSLKTNASGYVDPDLTVVYTNVAIFKNWITDTVNQTGAARPHESFKSFLAKTSNLRPPFSRYTCQITDMDIQSDNIEVVSFSGSHLSQKTDRDVKQIIFRRGTLFFIPSGLGQIFENVKSMEIQENLNTKHIKRSDFKNLENLVDFRILKNEITTFDYDCHRDLQQLEILVIVENRLREIEERTFETNVNLKEVHLYGNKIEILPKNLLQNNLLLEIFSFDNNFLSIIDESIFEMNINLKKVYLYENKLEILPSDLFRNNSLLEVVGLGNNSLKTINECTFETNINLKTVDLHGNGLGILPIHLFRNNLLLEKVNLSSIYLRVIDECTFETNINLKIVDLHGNKLVRLPRHLFQNNSLLEIVSINDNFFGIIDESTFQTNFKLKVVDLSFNKLDVIPRYLFRHNSLLQKVDLRWNSLTIIEADFTCLKNIESIYFIHNKCIDAYYEGYLPEIYRNQFRNLTEFQNLIKTNCSE